MRIYLMRHGIAQKRSSSGDDASRDLTDEGIASLRKCGGGLKILMGCPDLILSSPLIRAFRTAELVAKKVGYKKLVVITELLKPGHSAARLRAELVKYKEKESILLVGHEPGLGNLAAFLLDARRNFFGFKKGALSCIKFADRKTFTDGTLEWAVPPRILKRIS